MDITKKRQLVLKYQRIGLSILSKGSLVFVLIYSSSTFAVCHRADIAGRQNEMWCDDGNSSSSSSRTTSTPSKTTSQDRTIAAIGALLPHLEQLAANSEAKRQEEAAKYQQQLEESKRKEAERLAKEKRNQQEFDRIVTQVSNDPSTDPWSNDTSNKKASSKKQNTDRQLGVCVEQNFSNRSDGKFALRNTCSYPINIKFTFSESHRFSGTYETLHPNHLTFATAEPEEVVKYYMCSVPRVPQTINGGCI